MNIKDTLDTKGSQQNHNKSSANDDLAHLNGATIIDENGKEIPITEEMIQQACNELLEAVN